MATYIVCGACVENGCYPDVCRCSCHPKPIGLAAKLRKVLGITRMMPGTKHWDPNAKFISRDTLRLADLEVRHMELLEAARASIAAHRDGEADPLIYIHAVLERHGQLPPADMHPVQILALCTGCGTAVA